MSDNSTRMLLPAYVKKPFMLVWTNVLPQAVLVFMNLYAYWLIKDELNRMQGMLALGIFSAELLLICISAGIWRYCEWKKTALDWKWSVFLVVSHLAYLWYVSSEIPHIVPSQIEVWILDTGILTLNQFVFMMPALFYAGIQLACFDTRLSFSSDFGRSVAVAILVPGLWYVVSMGFMVTMRGGGSWVPQILIILFFVTITLFSLLAIIRSGILFYTWFQSRDRVVHLISIALVALVGPLAGLGLNAVMPFPYDFQSAFIYILAALNGLILLVPGILRLERKPWLLFLTCATYPFTVYFFLVFLPFLPLSLVAILAMGMGILILIPTVLFLLHTKILIADIKQNLDQQSRSLVFTLILSALILLPGTLLINTVYDRVVLHRALKYVYSSDYSKANNFKGSADQVKDIMVKMKEIKKGAFLPYMSGLYSQIVFDSMILSESKIEYMYHLFSGEKMPKIRSAGGSFWGRGFSDEGIRGVARRRPPQRNVDLKEVTPNITEEEGVVKARIQLEMNFPGRVPRDPKEQQRSWFPENNLGEFQRQINLAPGVLVTGFSLKVGEEWVPGQIFEKKAALWVYHMIRDFTARDPGILVYKSPTKVEFNVYPFQPKETRYAQIEFQYPAGFNPVVTVGDQEIKLFSSEAKKESKIVAASDGEGFAYVILGPKAQSSLPAFERKPYLHFILDYSAGTESIDDQYARRMIEIMSQFKSIKSGKITVANFEYQDLTDSLIALDQPDNIRKVLRTRTLPSQGALDISRALKQQLMEYQEENLSDPSSSGWKDYPVFIILTNVRDTLLDSDKMEFYSLISPESNQYYVCKQNNALEERIIGSEGQDFKNKNVLVLKAGSKLAITPVQTGRMQWALFNNAESSDAIYVYDNGINGFKLLENMEKISSQNVYSRGLDLLAQNFSAMQNPVLMDALDDSLVEASRQWGVLVPATAYIVVERSSQWKTLQVREQQSLKAQRGFEFEDDANTQPPLNSPAPPAWVLLVIMMIWNGLRSKRMKLQKT